MSDIQSALSEIQMKLNAPKNQYNKFGKYAYRSCEDIMEGLKKVLGGCSVTINDDIQMVGARIYVKATATLHLGNESISVSAFAREEENKKGMDSAQLTGSTSSYARKYALNGLFLIDDNKDADSNENKQQSGNEKPPVNIDSNIIAAIDCNDHNWVKGNWSGIIKNEWSKLNTHQIEKLNQLINQQ